MRLASALTSVAFSARSRSVDASGDVIERLGQFVAGFGEPVDQRPRRLVEDLGDLGRAFGKHGVELARVRADRTRRFIGALTDVLADRREGLGNDVGARDELGLGLRDLLAELLAHRLGARGEAVFRILDMSVDAGCDCLGPGRELLVGGGKRFLDGARAGLQFSGGLLCARHDALLGFAEGADDAFRVFADGDRAVGDPGGKPLLGIVEQAADLERAARQDLRRFVDPGRDLPVGSRKHVADLGSASGKDARGFGDAVGEALVGFLEVEDDLAGLGAERRGAVGDAVGKALVCFVEDAAEFAGARFEFLGAIRDAGHELFVGLVEDAAEFRSAGGKRIGGFADAHAEALIGVVEVAQNIAGARGQRTRRLHGAGNQLLVRVVEDAGDVAGARRHEARHFFAAGEEGAGRGVGPSSDLAVRLAEGVCDRLDTGEQSVGCLFGAFGHAAVRLGKGVAGLFVKRIGDFEHLVAQGAGDNHRALFEHLADIVDAEVQRALHRAGTLFDDAGLAAERFLDLLDIGGDRLRDVDALAGDRLDMRGDRAYRSRGVLRRACRGPRREPSPSCRVRRRGARRGWRPRRRTRRGLPRPSAGLPAAPWTASRGLPRSSVPARQPGRRYWRGPR